MKIRVGNKIICC